MKLVCFDWLRRLAVTAVATATMIAMVCVSASPSRALDKQGYVRAEVGSHAAEPQAPQAVTIIPDPAHVSVNETQIFTAEVRTPGGGVIIPYPDVTWSVSNNAGKLISNSTNSTHATATVKVTTAAGGYADAIAATTQLFGSASADIVVSPAALASITITPSTADMVVDSLQTFTAVGRDEFGNVINGLNVTWAVSPTAGSIVSSGPTTMTFRSGTTPNSYIRAVRASSGAIVGTANVFLRPGPVNSVVISPTAVTLDINATQLFTASALDKFGNPRPDLGVTWLTPSFNGLPAGTIETSTATSAVFRAGTVAGKFAGVVQASNPPGLGSATITIRPGTPAQAQMSADPDSIKTDGLSSSTIGVIVTDQYGNLVGDGVPVDLAVDECTGACILEPLFGATNSQSRFSAVLRSTNTSATQTVTSNIRVNASVNGGVTFGVVDVPGSFTPYRQNMPMLARDWPNNYSSCTALVLSPPATFAQPANNPFIIYRFTALAASYTAALSNYSTTGQLLLYRVIADNCPVNISVSFIQSAPITASSFQTTFANAFTSGQSYLLAVNTTGSLTNEPYTIAIQP